ncbi:MAG: hypothetical protein SOX57_09410 [Schaalia hyovaginalis]|uniref:hypothetical protein n=1 Tax=Schaalia hyovaginalis TaxID=29316 RepID=UPI002A830DAF|nr:hypothetical protein [Schaalia hyovaginalis]MDY4263530.1 hypothetical protein [Schaalia hyovaginalis]
MNLRKILAASALVATAAVGIAACSSTATPDKMGSGGTSMTDKMGDKNAMSDQGAMTDKDKMTDQGAMSDKDKMADQGAMSDKDKMTDHDKMDDGQSGHMHKH